MIHKLLFMENLLVFTSVELILVTVTGFFFIIQLLYWLISYSRPLRRIKKVHPEKPGNQPPVSVVVYAKNESENLRRYLPALLTQDYPEYEVIVVNDGSTDESDNVLKSLKQEYSHLYHTYIPEDVKYLSRKKLALTVGIKATKYDIVLLTEANCYPLSEHWIRSMSQAYKEGTEIVLGFCAYHYRKGFMHQLIAYDNLINGLQYISAALVHQPFTGNGRNLSYKKELFFQQKGYYKSLALHAGDDDLFVNESATKRNTQVVYSPDSITEMAAVDYFKIWKEMKVSRAATKKRYKGYKLFFYRFEVLTHILLLFSAIATILAGLAGNWLISVAAGILFLIRYITKAVILHKSAKMLHQKPTTGWLFLLEIIQPVFNIYVRIYRVFRGKNDYTFRLG